MLNNAAALFGSPIAPSTASFESIATVTLASASTGITFSSIPQTYTSLQIRGIGTSNTRTNGPSFYLNGVSTGTSYAYHTLWADGTSAQAQGYASQPYIGGAGLIDTTYPTAWIYDIHDYTSTSRNKTIRWFCGNDTNSGTAGQTGTIWNSSGLYMSTSAITQIDLYNGYTWKAGTTFALYGIKGA